MRSRVETLLRIDERMSVHVLKIDDDESSPVGALVEAVEAGFICLDTPRKWRRGVFTDWDVTRN
jgi:hypothetical protein